MLKKLIEGIFKSDGYYDSKDYRECIDTVSERLVLEIKECLMYLKIKSTVKIREPFKRGEYLCQKSYKIVFKGLFHESKTKTEFDKIGYWSKIFDISINKTTKEVYDISVEDIAEVCGLNRSYFGKIFKETLGRSPQEFLMNYRMVKATELLKLTQLSISEISNAVGYANPLHFSRAFKNVYGESPRIWRQNHRT